MKLLDLSSLASRTSAIAFMTHLIAYARTRNPSHVISRACDRLERVYVLCEHSAEETLLRQQRDEMVRRRRSEVIRP